MQKERDQNRLQPGSCRRSQSDESQEGRTNEVGESLKKSKPGVDFVYGLTSAAPRKKTKGMGRTKKKNLDPLRSSVIEEGEVRWRKEFCM